MADETGSTPPPAVDSDTKEPVAEAVEKEATPEPQVAEEQQEETKGEDQEPEAPKEEETEPETAEPKTANGEASREEDAPKEEEQEPEAPKEEETPSAEPKTANGEASREEDAPKDEEERAPNGETAAEAPKETTAQEEQPAPVVEEPAAPKHPPRVKLRTSDPAEPVDFAFNDTKIGSTEPITIGALFKKTKERFPNNPALAYEVDGEEGWTKITYTEYYDLCVKAAKSFLKLELEPLHGVAIIGFNSAEWFIANMGAIFAGGLSCGVYATNSADVCQYIADDCQANIAVVEDQKQLDKFLQIRKDLPHLKAIVQYKGKLSEQHPDVYDWEQFLKLGDTIDNSVVEKKISDQKPGDCASLIYTSGTTGSPKGVMLSHDNITWTVNGMEIMYENFVPGDERIVSYLPLSHIAAQIADMYFELHIGGQTFFARPDALKGSLRVTLLDVQPTLFFAVPRVWEKFMEAIQSKAPTGGVKKMISSWAKGKGRQGSVNIRKGGSMPFGWGMANKMVFNKVKDALGLRECRIFSTSAAPIRREVLEYFSSLNIPLVELWGMSEGTGPIISNIVKPGCWKIGSVGKPYPGVELMLHNKDEHGEGEVCFRARNMMMGYLHKEEKTRETIDDEGWLHSGDLGKIDEDGFLFITGRIKELIITSGGENVPPVPIEDRIKKEIPFLSNVMVVGDHRNFLTCLVTLKCVVDAQGDPTDELAADAIDLIAALGCSATKVSQIVDNQERAVFSAIQEGIDRANKGAVSTAQTVKKWTLIDVDFCQNGGELGPTLKLKRFYVLKKFEETIDALYTPVPTQQ